MKYYLIAGEKSGDLHGGNLVRELRKLDPAGEFRAWGGDQMQAAGATLDQHIRDTAFMGFWEVAKNLPKILGLVRQCQRQVAAFQPDVLILIDYAGFNLRMAAFAKKLGIRTFYYISPKIWAWNQGRGWKVKALVDRMFVIMPFEKEFYQKFAFQVDYVGNPLLDAVGQFRPNPDFRTENGLTDRPLVALLPGSRRQEVASMLALMMRLPAHYLAYEFVVAGVDSLPPDAYGQALAAGVKIVFNQTYDLLHTAHAALVNSGTATLETALFNVPQVVCYRTSFLTAAIVRLVIKVRYASLVNLIAGREVVKELLQENFTESKLRAELGRALAGPARAAQLAAYQQVRQLMETGQSASALTAQLMWGYLGGGA
jgi:lipid-A-disaccharide synthase